MRTTTQPQPEERKRYGRTWDVDRIYGIKRSTLYALLSEGVIRSAVVKQKGAKSGLRLFDLESVENFLRANTK
jgi:hypothetical protein